MMINLVKMTVGVILLTFSGVVLATGGVDQVALERGKALAFDRNKGNCLACHMIPGGEFPGNFGPALIQMKLRFPQREVLREQLWDATMRNPKTMMPPFGKHGILSDEEIDLVIDYLYTL